ncbi:MAG TPA: ammonium transporter [Nevskiales bacterium]|nr:ammonium transporter [Nevskiales bacterium]
MIKLMGSFALLALLPGAALADTALDSGDTAWMLTSTALVLFMTLPGLALFYGGLVRSKNVLSVLMQCLVIACLASVLWVLFVYSLAFGPGGPFIGGLSKAFMNGVSEDALSGTIPESVFVMFQMTFAIITPALIVGAFAERMRFTAMLMFSALWLILVYAPVAHWVWAGDGWLYKQGLLDFAGGTVVHTTCGIAALVCALVLKPRSGFPEMAMMPHNLTMTVMGAGMLWVGWFGFNAGSAVSAGGNAGMAMLVTHTSAAAGALAWMALEWIKYGKPSVLGVATGVIAGLATITPASGYVGPGGALLIGLAAGVVCFGATNYMKRALKVDDSLDVFPVHGVGGMLGTLAAGVFASAGLGLLSGQGYAEGMSMGRQMGVQLLGIFVIAIYTAIVSFMLLKLVDAITGLRVSAEEETMGLDTSQHNERGYDL